MKLNTINNKLLLIITGAFVASSVCVILLATYYFEKIIDATQAQLYSKEVDEILVQLERNYKELLDTIMVEAYEEQFQDSILTILRENYYRQDSLAFYPFIIDFQGRVVMHPKLRRGDESIAEFGFVKKMIELKQGNFNGVFNGIHQWTTFKSFEKWRWIVGYAIPLDIKYADSRRFRYILAFIISLITILDLIALSAAITRFTRPIIKLTRASSAMAAGNLDQQISIGGKDELGVLARSFSHMRESIRDTIKALQESEEKYRELSDLLPQIVFETDQSGNLTFANRIAFDLFGYSRDDFNRGINVLQMLIPEDRDTAKKNIKRILEGEKVAGTEYTALKKDASIYPVLMYATPIVSEGNHVGVRGILADLSEVKRAKAALEDSEERLRLTLEAAQIGIFDWDVTHDRWHASPVYYRMLGYEPVDGPGNRLEWLERVHPDDRTDVSKKIQAVLQHNPNAYQYEARLRYADGTYRWQYVRGFGVKRDQQGNVTRVLGIRMDINERKQIEQALAMQEQKYRTLVENSPDLIVRYNADLRRIFVNPAWEKASGLTAAEVVDVPPADIPKVPQPVVKEYFAKLRSALETGTPQVSEFSWVNTRGEKLFLNYVIVPEYDQNGNIIGVLSVGHDITTLKQVEEEVRTLNQELEQRVIQRTAQLEAANKELEAFAYSVSHDLRAPLRHIDGFIELLKQKAGTNFDEQSRHYMACISDAAQKMGLLIDDLLSFSRMGRHAISFQPVNLGPLVRDIMRELEPDVAGRNIEWRIGDLPVVSGDASMLRIVLDNLISNALKFTQPRQQAEIEIGWMPDIKTETTIFVRDNGVGFDMNYADKLFNVFQRLHRVDEFEGTGIGLANVRRIIAKHGGRNWAEGKVDQGATFFFSLPSS